MQTLALLAIIPEIMVACMIAVGIREAWIGGRAWKP